MIAKKIQSNISGMVKSFGSVGWTSTHAARR